MEKETLRYSSVFIFIFIFMEKETLDKQVLTTSPIFLENGS